mmetsp:Transcript_20506/g.31757  ORF Transcript_20506/g.31757 Transcript_20506/m.31757 type:complete len:81 (-) Transcript_20506:73-315(-)
MSGLCLGTAESWATERRCCELFGEDDALALVTATIIAKTTNRSVPVISEKKNTLPIMKSKVNSQRRSRHHHHSLSCVLQW